MSYPVARCTQVTDASSKLCHLLEEVVTYLTVCKKGRSKLDHFMKATKNRRKQLKDEDALKK